MSVVVTGKLGLIDAQLIHFLQDLREHFSRVTVAPSEAAFAPAVCLRDLRYFLSQLSCVDEMMESFTDSTANSVVVDFPGEFIGSAIEVVRLPITHDEKPSTCSDIEMFQRRHDPLVLLTGCFDLIHAGHVRLIEQSTQYGARPVVAMLTTRAIQAQPKNVGRKRPLWNMADRVTVLSALRSQPRVLLFDGPDCLELIETLRPDVWVKEHRDWQRPIVQQEAKLVEHFGGRVVWIKDTEFNTSTTAIQEAITGFLSAV